MKIRNAKIEDLNEICRIERSSFDISKYHLISRRSFRRAISSPSCILLVAEEDSGEVSGYAYALQHSRRKDLRFYALAVDPLFQGFRVGAELFSAIASKARDFGLSLQCEIRSDNKKLFKRYSDFGLREYKRVNNYYPDGGSCIKMRN